MHRLTDKVAAALGMMTRTTWPADIIRAIDELSARHGCKPEDLITRIDTQPGLLNEVASFLTVGETFFLRHPTHFHYLFEALAERYHRLGPSDRLAVWSAGCSTGEEPYSVAVMLDNGLGANALGRFEIFGTDVNPRVIEKAMAGSYSAWSFRNAPAWLLARYFTSTDSRTCKLDRRILRAVKFDVNAIEARAQEFPDRSLDVVLFRNVAIYLTHEAIQRLYRQFHRILRKDGLLLVAPSDPRPAADLFTATEEESTSVYRLSKPADAKPRPVAPTFARQPQPSRRRRRATFPSHLTPQSPTPRAPQATFEASPASPTPRSASKPPPPAPEVVSPAALTGDGSHFGDRGDIKKALEIVSVLITAEPASGPAYLTRGQLHMADHNIDEAVADLRRAVFLQPEEHLPRFWLANAFLSAGQQRRALNELSTLRAQLSSLAGESLLGDNETTAAELLDAVDFMRESLE